MRLTTQLFDLISVSLRQRLVVPGLCPPTRVLYLCQVLEWSNIKASLSVNGLFMVPVSFTPSSYLIVLAQ